MWEIKVWVLIGALAVTTTVIGFLVKVVATNLINKMDEVVSKIDKLIQDTTTLQQKVNNLEEKLKAQENRLNNHADRIRSLEIKTGKQ